MQESTKINHENQCLQMYSDGSVKNMVQSGTYAWMVTKKTNRQTSTKQNTGNGERSSCQIECVRIHSYTAEAIGLLSGLLFLQHVDWKGRVEGHTDSQSVIDTWKRLHCKYEPNWLKRKERDVWMRLSEGTRRYAKKEEHRG